MNQHHIVTVGISLLSNFARSRNLSAEVAIKHHQAIAAFLRADPRKACAEINSLDSRTGFLQRNEPGLVVTLAFTTTHAGKLCASMIEKELMAHKVTVQRLPVKGVDTPARDFTPEFAARECAESLADLRQRVTDHVTRLRGKQPDREIQFNCTGGYKAECAVLYELGRTLRIPVYYLHETYKTAITLP